MGRWIDTRHGLRSGSGLQVDPPNLVPAAVEGMGSIAVIRERIIGPDPFKYEPPSRGIDTRFAQPFHFQERIEGQALWNSLRTG